MFLAVKQALVNPEACTEQELKSIFYLHQISLYDSTPAFLSQWNLCYCEIIRKQTSPAATAQKMFIKLTAICVAFVPLIICRQDSENPAQSVARAANFFGCLSGKKLTGGFMDPEIPNCWLSLYWLAQCRRNLVPLNSEFPLGNFSGSDCHQTQVFPKEFPDCWNIAGTCRNIASTCHPTPNSLFGVSRRLDTTWCVMKIFIFFQPASRRLRPTGSKRWIVFWACRSVRWRSQVSKIVPRVDRHTK